MGNGIEGYETKDKNVRSLAGLFIHYVPSTMLEDR